MANTKARILELLAEARRPLGVAELTHALGCNHNNVRRHLARLQADGLVDERAEARNGPGRRRMLYTAVTPPDPYARLARLLLNVATTKERPRQVGRDAGREAAKRWAGRDVVDACELEAARGGFRPRRAVNELTLQDCPIADVAVADPRTICSLHRGLMEGIAAATGGGKIESFVAKDPHTANCQIRVRRLT
jgi:predicted ArsR family transcriptional regulator